MGAIIKMPDLINLAVKMGEEVSPELLKTVLQSMVNHMNMNELKVEFRGSDSQKIQDLVKNSKKEISVHLLPEVAVRESKESFGKEQSFHVESLTSGDGSLKKLVEGDDVIVVENGIPRESTRRRTVSYVSFSRLENKVTNVQAQIEALNVQVLPTDDALLQATRSKQEAKPISDLMQSLNITKRMTGAEEGLDKLASLLETVAKEYADLRKIIDQLQEELGENVADTMKQIKMAANYAKQIRPREDLLEQYRARKIDVSTSAIELHPEYAKNEDEALTTPVVSQTNITSSTIRETGTFADVELSTQASSVRSVTATTSSNKKIGLKPTFSSISRQDPSKTVLYTGSSKIQKQTSLQFGEPRQSELNVPLDDTVEKEPSIFDVIPKLKPTEFVDGEKMNKFLAQHEYVRKNMEYLTAQINTLAEFADHILPEILAGMPHATELRKRIAELQKDTKPACPEGPDDGDDVIVTSKDLNERMEGAEVRLVKHQAKLKRQDAMMAEKTLDIDNRIGRLTKSLAEVVDVLGLRKRKLKPKDEEQMDQVFGKIGNIEEALIEIGCATQNLLDDKEYKMTLLESLTEEMKLLKSLKLDRFEVEDILANKADCDELNKKVPLDRFDEAMNDLARGLDDALNKVSAQESLLTSTLLEIQSTIETKFDKEDVETLKEEMNSKLQALREAFDKLSAAKEGRVAAGGKRKFLTDVNCLSCDRNVVMPTETGIPCIPVLADMTHMRSVRPFIAYELEYLRKMKIKDPDVIKYIEYEELFRRYKLKTTDSYENLAEVPHLKNRYCGGGNTVTGPIQKVPHAGHFDLKSLKNKNN